MAEIKTGVFAKNVQKRISRAQEKVLQKLGKADETKDEEFDQCVQNFKRQEFEGARLQREMKAYIAAVKGMQQASMSLTESLHEVYEPEWHGKDDVMSIGKNCDVLWEDFHEKLVDSTILALDTYLAQFPDLKVRVAKRSRKLIDYDSARHHFETLQTSAVKSERKVAKAEEDLKKAQKVFDDLNVDLQDELPNLWDSRVGFYVNTFKSVSSLEAKFHREISIFCHKLYEVMNKLAEQHSDKMFTIQGAPSDSGPLRLARTPTPPEDESPEVSPAASPNHTLRPTSPGPPRPKSPSQLKMGPPKPPPPKVTPTKEIAQEQIINLFDGGFPEISVTSPQANEKPTESLLDLDFDPFKPDSNTSVGQAQPPASQALSWDLWTTNTDAQPASDAGFNANWTADFGSVTQDLGDVKPATDGQGWPPADGWSTDAVLQGEATGEVRSWDENYDQKPNADCGTCTLKSDKIEPPFEQQPVQEGTEEGWASEQPDSDIHHFGWTGNEEGWTAEQKTTCLEESVAGKSMPGIIFTNEFGQEIAEVIEQNGQGSYSEEEGNISKWSLTCQGELDGSGSEYETAEEWGDAPGQNSGWMSADDELDSAENERTTSDQNATRRSLNQEDFVGHTHRSFPDQSTMAVASFIGHTFIGYGGQIVIIKSTNSDKETELGHHSSNYVFSTEDPNQGKEQCDPCGSRPDPFPASEVDPFGTGINSFANSDKNLLASETSQDPICIETDQDPFANKSVQDPFANEIDWDPFVNQNNQDSFTNESNWDLFANKINQDPFASEISQDPFESETNQDSFESETNQDPFACETNQDPFACETNQDPFNGETNQDLFASEINQDPLVSETNQDPFESETNQDPLAKGIHWDPEKDPLANKTNQDPLASEADLDPYASEINKDPFASKINEDPVASETNQDPFANETVQDLFNSDTNEDPFASVNNQDPFASETVDLFSNKTNQDTSTSKINQDNFSSETNQDCFANETYHDLFVSETDQDPFANNTIWDPFATENTLNNFISETKQDSFARETIQDPFTSETNHDPFNIKINKDYFASDTYQYHSETIQDPFANKTNWDSFPSGNNQAPFTNETNLNLFYTETSQDPFDSECVQDPFTNKTIQDLFTNEAIWDPFAFENNQDLFACKIKLEAFASENHENDDPFANETNQNSFTSENEHNAFVTETTQDYITSETNQDMPASATNQSYLASETPQNLFASSTHQIHVLGERDQDTLANKSNQGWVGRWESTMTSGEARDSTRYRFAQWAVFPPPTAALECSSKDSWQELENSGGFFTTTDRQGDILPSWSRDSCPVQDSFVACHGQNNVPSPKTAAMEKTSNAKEQENSDLSEDEVANRRYGKLYQEIDAEKEEVSNRDINGLAQADTSAATFVADFDKMSETPEGAETGTEAAPGEVGEGEGEVSPAQAPEVEGSVTTPSAETTTEQAETTAASSPPAETASSIVESPEAAEAMAAEQPETTPADDTEKDQLDQETPEYAPVAESVEEPSSEALAPADDKESPIEETPTVEGIPQDETGTVETKPGDETGTLEVKPEEETGTLEVEPEGETGTLEVEPEGETGTLEVKPEEEPGTLEVEPEGETGTVEVKPGDEASKEGASKNFEKEDKMPIPSVVIEPASSNEGDDDRDGDILSPTASSGGGVTPDSQSGKDISSSGMPAGFLYKVETMHDFEAANTDELDLKKGDIVLVVPTELVEDQDAGWLTGIREIDWLHHGASAQKGLFPENFIQRLG